MFVKRMSCVLYSILFIFCANDVEEPNIVSFGYVAIGSGKTVLLSLTELLNNS